MKSILTLCLLCCAMALAGPVRAAEILSPHGDFLQWAPTAPTMTYADVDLPPDYKARERAAETPVAEPFVRLEVHLGADGTIRRSGSRARFYLTQSGVQRSGNLTFWVDSFSEIATIEQAYTLFPDGRRLDVDPNSVQLIQEISDNIFSDAYEVIVPFYGLEKDAVAVLVTRIEEKPGVWPLPWSRVYFPRTFVPRGEFQFSLTWDDGVEDPLWQTDYADFACTTPSPRQVLCRAEDIAIYPDDPNVHYRDVLPSLVVSERTSWQELAGMVGAFVDSAITDDVALDTALDRLLAGAEDDQERLRRMHRFVSQDIRYIGLEQGLGGIIPRPAAQTLASRFGDCKDKTTLFIALARQAGMDAYPVLTTFDRFDPSDTSDFTDWQGWLSYEARSSRSDNIHHNYRFPGLKYTERAEYRLPETRRLGHVGAQISFETPFGVFQRNSRLSGGALAVVTELSIPSVEIPPDRIAEFNAFIGHITDNASIVFSTELQ